MSRCNGLVAPKPMRAVENKRDKEKTYRRKKYENKYQ
jgi:hypothetical protein